MMYDADSFYSIIRWAAVLPDGVYTLKERGKHVDIIIIPADLQYRCWNVSSIILNHPGAGHPGFGRK